MDDKRALLIGGGGTLGEYAALELLKAGWSVDVLAPEELTSRNRRLRYFRGRADDMVFREAWTYDRALSRLVDCSKMRDVCGLGDADFLPIRAGIVQELHYLQGRPDLIRRFDTELGSEIGRKTDDYLKAKGLA